MDLPFKSFHGEEEHIFKAPLFMTLGLHGLHSCCLLPPPSNFLQLNFCKDTAQAMACKPFQAFSQLLIPTALRLRREGRRYHGLRELMFKERLPVCCELQLITSQSVKALLIFVRDVDCGIYKRRKPEEWFNFVCCGKDLS